MDMFDVSQYVTPTRFSGLSGVFLARAVLKAAPATPSPRVREALLGVREAGEHLRAVVRQRMRSSPRNLRPLDIRLDSGWVGLRETIEAKSRLEGTPAAQQATELLLTLFPEGTSFVRNGYREQWAASQLHLERIEEEGLRESIEALVGTEFLPFVQQAHDDFGEAIGVGDNIPPSPDTAALKQASTDLAQAIAEYGRILAGELDRANEDEVAAFRQAVAPVDEQRRVTSRSRTRSQDEVDDDLEAEDPTEAEREIAEPLPVVQAA